MLFSEKKNLTKTCKQYGLKYIWLGDKLGGKSNSNKLKQYLNGPNAKTFLQVLYFPPEMTNQLSEIIHQER